MPALALTVCLTLPGQTDAQDRAALQGTWRAIEATSNGDPPPAGMLEKLTLVFAGEKVSIMGKAPTGFKIDTSFQPAHIDFLNSRHQVGIYELKGDTLKLCTGMDGDRPTTFRTEKYTDHTYILLKRTKQ
ncbi:MAG: TIGR03067 domain-containing protein [Acidobacteriia bacterium]|nr:TIGR03067 domain-containing protein [Terriglobia bacterium]